MNRICLHQKGIRCSRHMQQMIMKAENELNAEGVKQMALVNLSSAIALIESWGWSNDKIKALYDKEEEILDQCSNVTDLSLISMFDYECNIELTNRDGISYKDFRYFNTGKDINEYTAPQLLQMMQNQKQWLGAIYTAAMGLALFRIEGWDEDEVASLIQKMQEIKDVCNYEMPTMSAYAKEKVNFDINDLMMAA